LVVQASPDAGTTSAVIVSSSKFLRVLAARWLGVFRQSCGSSDVRLLIEEQVAMTEIRLVHLSMEIPRPRTKTPYIPPTQTGRE
jgi:hypothetical protein